MHKENSEVIISYTTAYIHTLYFEGSDGNSLGKTCLPTLFEGGTQGFRTSVRLPFERVVDDNLFIPASKLSHRHYNTDNVRM